MKILGNKKGQGTTEYIVIIAIAVAIIFAMFYGQIKPRLQSATNTIGDNIANSSHG